MGRDRYVVYEAEDGVQDAQESGGLEDVDDRQSWREGREMGGRASKRVSSEERWGARRQRVGGAANG